MFEHLVSTHLGVGKSSHESSLSLEKLSLSFSAVVDLPSRFGPHNLVAGVGDAQRAERSGQMLDADPARVPAVPTGGRSAR